MSCTFEYFQTALIHYNYHRDYDPAIGRYLESDPAGLLAGINTYGYVDSSPVDSADPKGLSKKPKPEYIYVPCGDTNTLHCVNDCIKRGQVFDDCTERYTKLPGVNNGKETYRGYTCVCKDREPPKPPICDEGCQRAIAYIGAILIMICTKRPYPLP